MKNFEKYEKEIKTALSQKEDPFTVTSKLSEKEFLSTDDILNWLYEEEPLLTNKEREYLSSIIKPVKENFKYLTKRGLDGTIQIRFADREIISFYLPLAMPLRNLECEKEYSLEELGL